MAGGDESAEFLRQTRDFATALGGTAELLHGAKHFAVIAPLAEPESGLARHAAALALAVR